MDKYKKIVLKLLRIYGGEAMSWMKEHNTLKAERYHKWEISYIMDALTHAVSNFKKFKEYRIILEATKGYHSEWI